VSLNVGDVAAGQNKSTQLQQRLRAPMRNTDPGITRQMNRIDGIRNHSSTESKVVLGDCIGDAIPSVVEYERTRKLERHYDAIAAKMKAERYVDQFLYLTANEHLLKLVSWSFRNSDVRVYFGLLADWHRRLLEVEAFSWKAMGYRRLATLLLENSTQTQALPQQRGLRFASSFPAL
jgi:hypothetical protein